MVLRGGCTRHPFGVPMQTSFPGLLRHARIVASLSVILVPMQAALAQYPELAFSGDARVRYEDIEIEPGADVNRERYRARLALETGLSESLTFNVRLATGTGDPVSTNLNFGESFTLDDIQLDRAWLEWRISDTTDLHAGKMKNPFHRPGGTSLTWDSDLNPEGIAATFERSATYVTAAVFHVADQGEDHSRLVALQAGRAWDVGTEGELSVGAGYFDYTNTRGQRPFYRGLPAGNTVDADGNYVYDYDIVELYVGYEFAMRGVPVELFADWVRNLDPDRENRAYAVGARVGSADERGRLAASWAWHDTGADALIGVFTDSDLGGGNTDSRGQVFTLEFALTDDLVLGGTLILSEFGHFSGLVRDYDRVMLDMEFSF